MKRILSIATILMLIVCSGCGGDTPDKVANDTVTVMEDVVAVMEGVKDEASAKAAAGKFRALGDKIKEIQARQDKLGLTASQKAELKKKHEAKMDAVMTKLLNEGMRISSNPKLAPAMEGLEAAMKQNGPM